MEEVKNTFLNTQSIGKRIREEREAMKLTREELAELLGISSYYLGQLERGERQMILPVLVKISEKLHVSPNYLILGKKFHESHDTTELEALIKKCSKKELELIQKLIKIILPYID